MNAFLYLVLTSARNRFRARLRRARSPRYAAALIVGGVYIWLFLLRPANTAFVAPVLLGQPTEMIVTLLTVITLMGSWVFGSDATALAFTQAELSLLFPAPLSRRSLIGYKLFRAQMIVLVNSLIWVFVLRRGGSVLPSPMRALSLWVLFSTLNLHRLAAALVRASWREHGRTGVRRHRWSIAVFLVITAVLLVAMFNARASLLAGDGIGAFFTQLGRVLASPPASWVLLPFHLVVAPTFARTPVEWQRVILPAIGVLVVHIIWVLRTDAAFEDAAIEASAERARRLEAMQSRRSIGATSPPRRATSTIALAAVGHPAHAIFWKNMLCLRRTMQLRLFLGPLVMAAAMGLAVAGSDWGTGGMIATSAGILSLMLLVFGGRLIRNDLRQDMQHLPLLKSLPVASHELMLAEVMSAAVPMAVLQYTLIAIAYLAALWSPAFPIPYDMRAALIITAPFAVMALNVALLTIQNGTVVLFPSWVRLGPAVNTGVEALGQNVLATTSNLFSLGVGLVIPAGAAFYIIQFFGGGELTGLAVALVMLLGAVILAAETYVVIRFLGRVLAKAEPI
jgi:ABC-2 type transport system permease protein